MQWNLRLTAANKGIWKASELQRSLAEHGLVISAGKVPSATRTQRGRCWNRQPSTRRGPSAKELGPERGDLKNDGHADSTGKA